MLNLDTRIPLQVQERDYGRGFDTMQQSQMNQLKLQALRDEYNAAKEEKIRQKQMRKDMASELQKLQQGTLAQYNTTFPQTMPTGQMPQGMTGVLASERGQNMPQPALFGENILEGNFDINRETVSPAVAGRIPDIKDYLEIRMKQAFAHGDEKGLFETAKLLKDFEKNPAKWGMNPTKGINEKGEADYFVVNELGQKQFLGVNPYETPKDIKTSLVKTSRGFEVVPEGELPKGAPVEPQTQPRQPRLQQVTNENGTFLLNIDTGETKPVIVGGKQLQPVKPAQTPSGEESNAAGFLVRMKDATKLLDKFEGKGKPSIGTTVASGVPLVGGYFERTAQTKEQQQYKNAALAWIRAKLRKESGAAIGIEEAKQEYQNYFPVVGDSDEVIAQKASLRQSAMDEMLIASGKAARKVEEARPTPTQSPKEDYMEYKKERDKAYKSGNYDLVRKLDALAKQDKLIK